MILSKMPSFFVSRRFFISICWDLDSAANSGPQVLPSQIKPLKARIDLPPRRVPKAPPEADSWS